MIGEDQLNGYEDQVETAKEMVGIPKNNMDTSTVEKREEIAKKIIKNIRDTPEDQITPLIKKIDKMSKQLDEFVNVFNQIQAGMATRFDKIEQLLRDRR